MIDTYTYNAQNHLTQTAGMTYIYDGDRKRVQKSNGQLYWYGMGSDPLDETDAAGNTNNGSFNEYIFFGGKRIARRNFSNNVVYYFADHLGTSRVVTNATGTVPPLDDSDFYPFAGERAVSSTSGNSYKFTGKERDTESGLDDFGARYYSSAMGRWMSPDWSATPAPVPYADLGNPQTLNLYAYVGNNPTNGIDPEGHFRLPSASETESGDQQATFDGSKPKANPPPAAQNQPQNQGWTLGWQLQASGRFLLGELKGVADATVTPILNAVEHPVATVEGLGHAVAHPIETAENVAKAAVDTAKGVTSGDPRAIGQVAGAVIATAAGVKGAQAATGEAQGLRVLANKVGRGPRAGELQHVGIVNNKGNIIHLGRQGTGWHIGIGRGGGASGAGAAFHIPIPSWVGKLLNP